VIINKNIHMRQYFIKCIKSSNYQYITNINSNNRNHNNNNNRDLVQIWSNLFKWLHIDPRNKSRIATIKGIDWDIDRPDSISTYFKASLVCVNKGKYKFIGIDVPTSFRPMSQTIFFHKILRYWKKSFKDFNDKILTYFGLYLA
jgi:hypothetical protein